MAEVLVIVVFVISKIIDDDFCKSSSGTFSNLEIANSNLVLYLT